MPSVSKPSAGGRTPAPLLDGSHRLRQLIVESTLFVGAQFQRLEHHGKPLERTIEPEWHSVRVLLEHRCSGVLSDVEGFVERKADPNRLRNAAFTNRLLVDQQCCGSGFADASGYVQMPNVNPMDEMVNMISAQQDYQADLEAFNVAKTLAVRTLSI